MSVEQKRLFVGGLNSGTTEQDIRDRFKTFGSIASVELHKVQKKEGFPEKTFAYVNIELSESNIRRCISMLSNTKWRGGTLKIELAKENFLTRLKKEREQLTSEKVKTSNNQLSSPTLPKELKDPVKNAVPGTLIQGIKNWVVGKFGRALPVVHMRPKLSNRILKFDPSKTVHNLKRIKDEEEVGKHVSDLTWSMEPRARPWDENKNTGNTITDFSSDNSDDGEFHGTTKTKAKFAKKRERKVSLSSCSVDSSDDDDGETCRTAKKKSKPTKVERNDKQGSNVSLNSCSVDSSDDGETCRTAKKKSKPTKAERKDKQGSNVSLNSCSVDSSADDSEIHNATKKKRKLSQKTERKAKRDPNDSSVCRYEDDLMKGDDQQSMNCDRNRKKKHKNTDTENAADTEHKPKRKTTTHKEKDFNNSLKDELVDIENNTQSVINDEVTSKTKQKKKKKGKRNKDEKDLISKNDNDEPGNERSIVIQNEIENNNIEKVKRKKKKHEEIVGDVDEDTLVSKLSETNSPYQELKTTDKPKRSEKKKVKETSKEKGEQQPIKETDNSLTQVDSEVDLQSKNDTKKLRRKDKQKKDDNIEENDLVISKENDEGHIKQQISNKVTSSKDSKDEENDEQIIKDDTNKKQKTRKQRKSETKLINEDITKTLHDKQKRNTKVGTKIDKTMITKGKKAAAAAKVNSTKKVTSNETRLRAIKEKEVNTSTMQSIVSSALQNLDSNDKPGNTRHITFDNDSNDNEDDDDEDDGGSDDVDDEDEDEGDKDDEGQGKREDKDTKHETQAKISGSKAANWLGLDSDSDEDTSTFGAKPQFEGKTGQKLFELQKSYRGDSRFQLDKRFAESEDDEDEEDDTTAPQQHDNDDDDDDIVDDDDDDKVAKQLSQEKDMAMSVLRGIIGENFSSKYDNSTRKQKYKDSNLLRYDPTKDDHVQFEQAPIKESAEPAVKERQPTPEDAMRSNVPEVDSDKYYDVNTDALTEMFSDRKKDASPPSFTFLSSQEDKDETSPQVEWGQAEILKSKPVTPVMLPYDSSGDEQDDDEMDQGQHQNNQHALQDERFFFHFGDPDLESNVFDQENAFMRTDTLEQLNQHWVNVRSELTQDYKKKHKDALRRQSKMAAKRARMR